MSLSLVTADGTLRSPAAAMGSAAAAASQIISFTVDAATFGIDILSVREIRVWQQATRLPHTPHHVRGVINLRGTITPILDFRARLGRGLTEPTPVHVVIIVAIRERVIGLLVDTVSDIIDLTADQIQPVPESVRFSGDDVVRELATIDGQMISLVDLETLVGDLMRSSF